MLHNHVPTIMSFVSFVLNIDYSKSFKGKSNERVFKWLTSPLDASKSYNVYLFKKKKNLFCEFQSRLQIFLLAR